MCPKVSSVSKVSSVQIKLLPGEKISPKFCRGLQLANVKRAQSLTQYMQTLCALGNLPPIKGQTEKHKQFLGGFILGEGSLNVSAKRGKGAVCGLYLDLEFSCTQHIHGFWHLINLCYLFQSGRISYKNGSNATLVFTIQDRTTLWEKVIPYWQKYITPHALDDGKGSLFDTFVRLLIAFREGKHRVADSFVQEMLPLWDSMRQQKGKGNESFSSLEEAEVYARLHQKHTKYPAPLRQKISGVE